MHFVTRFTDAETAARLPLPAVGDCSWTATATGIRAQVQLPDLPSGWIIVPSFSQLDHPEATYRFSLRTPDFGISLPQVPSRPDDRSGHWGTPRLAEAHVDCFHTLAPLPAAVLELDVHCASPPQRYWLALSARPLALTPPAPVAAAPAIDVPPISQLAAPADIARHICSPASVAMVLGRYGLAPAWPAFARQCRDVATGMYGAWPMALRQAGLAGSIGAVEVFSSWQAAETLLVAGLPFVASIRFEAGALNGAPLARTGGHLVVVRGLSAGRVLVNDPAGASAAEVMREYDAGEFSQAWLAQRGAGYILLP